MISREPQNQHVLKAIGLVLTAGLVFACMDVASKHLMTKFSVPLVAAVRYGLNLLFLMLLMAPRHGTALWATQRTGLVVLRGLSLAAATLFAGLALQRMPVGETVALLYLQGFGVMLAAAYLLRERVSSAGWIAAAIGFAGVLLIARPGGVLPASGVVFALLGAIVSVVYVLLSRSLAATESTMALLFHVALSGAIIFCVMLALQWQSFDFTRDDLLLLTFMGAASLGGHFLFTLAYRNAPASLLAPFTYFHIAFATLIGGVVYRHIPDALALTGMAMIGVSGAAIAAHAHFKKQA